jgi:DNA-binding beta-propeller fold protein YncE
MHISFKAATHVKDTLDGIGRTEDLAFSPDNRKLAIAAYTQNKILMLDIGISATADGNNIFISDCYEIVSADINLPHGIAWLDDQTIIVGNRFGQAIVLAVPSTQITQKQLELTAVQILPAVSNNSQHSNDCLAATPLGQGLYEVLVCSNSGNYVASHILDSTNGFSVIGGAILLENKIQIPDGVAFSPDRRWIAVSNHTNHSVYIYENVKSLNPASEPCAVLPGITYPHGITFTECAKFLFVTAAGDPFIYCYHNHSGEWHGEYLPFTKFKSLDDETFKRGNYNEQEGGTKGICFANNSNIMAMTCSEQPLAFVDMTTLMSALKHEALSAFRTETVQQNSDDYLQRTMRCMKINQVRLTKLHNENIQILLSSTSWKITQPLRVLKRILDQCATAIKSWQA